MKLTSKNQKNKPNQTNQKNSKKKKKKKNWGNELNREFTTEESGMSEKHLKNVQSP
jgi:hypothetical protein